MLVGTVTIEKSEILSSMLKKRSIEHKVLNAKHHEKEAEIINFYPVVDGKIELGDTSKYISSATKLTTINIAELHNLTKI